MLPVKVCGPAPSPAPQLSPTPSSAAAWLRSVLFSRDDSPTNAVLHDLAKSTLNGTEPPLSCS